MNIVNSQYNNITAVLSIGYGEIVVMEQDILKFRQVYALFLPSMLPFSHCQC